MNTEQKPAASIVQFTIAEKNGRHEIVMCAPCQLQVTVLTTQELEELQFKIDDHFRRIHNEEKAIQQ